MITFPEHFIWSSATSSYQIEGAANIDGKGPSIWDTYCKTKGKINDKSSGDVSIDSYHLYQKDIDALKFLGVNQYRFSISWPRILPDGLAGNVNLQGVQYYKNLIKGLKEANIEPVITLYHWDLPQKLQDIGGWLNSDIAGWFRNYAEVCFTEFGDNVKRWVTINEPHMLCKCAYGATKDFELAPGDAMDQGSTYPYIVAKNILLAHAEAVHLYREKFGNGTIGMGFNVEWFQAKNGADEEEANLAKLAFDFQFGFFAHPIYIGDYPASVIEKMEEWRKKERTEESRLNLLTKEEVERIKGTSDYLGLNYYVTFEVAKIDKVDEMTGDFEKDVGVTLSMNDKWSYVGDRNGNEQPYYPEGLTQILLYIKEHLGNTPVLILENGCMDDEKEGLEDISRINFFKAHLTAVHKAIEQGCNVKGFTVWSCFDNFEWFHGYAYKYGLFRVNHKSVEKERIPKASAKWYKKVIKKNAF
uniref:Beta-glucosidase n=1 Tax=Rhabditophanes sp. KR3021 TaxID=114890 RepID=A0AC35TXS6_9BILA